MTVKCHSEPRVMVECEESRNKYMFSRRFFGITSLRMTFSKSKPFSMKAMSYRTKVRDFMPYVLFAGDSSFYVVPFRMTSLHKGSSPNVIPSEAGRPTRNLLLFVWDSSLRLRCVQNDIAPEECHSCSEMLRSGTPLIILTNVGKKNPSQ